MSADAETVNAVNGEAKNEGFRVHIGNLPFSATQEQVRELASKVGGEIVSVELPTRFKRPAGYAFVGYKAEADAQKALEQLNGQEFGERKLTVALARSKEESLERRKANDAKRAAAKATQVQEGEAAEGNVAGNDGPFTGEEKPKKKRNNKKRVSRRRQPGEEGEEGEAAAEPEDAPAAAEAKPKRNARKPKEARIDADAGEETLVEKESKPRKKREPKLELTGELSKNTIFVANLPFNVDDDALSAIFTNLSINVKSAKVIQGLRRVRPGSKPFRASKGFGFVEVEDPAQQASAVEKVNGSLIGERTISARVANEMKPIEKEEVQKEVEATA